MRGGYPDEALRGGYPAEATVARRLARLRPDRWIIAGGGHAAAVAVVIAFATAGTSTAARPATTQPRRRTSHSLHASPLRAGSLTRTTPPNGRWRLRRVNHARQPEDANCRPDGLLVTAYPFYVSPV
jgi:hypothetical protein